MRQYLPLFIALSSAPAWAQQDTPFKFSAGYSLQTDSNLFRLPASANTNALIGASSAAEQIGVTNVGLGFATTQSLQKLEFNIGLVDYRYQNFSYLNFAARNFDAAWHWSLTPRWTGNLTTDRKETLNSYADFSGFAQRNRRTDTNTRLDTYYEIAGPWKLVAGISQARQDNEIALVGSGDYSSVSTDIGLRYAFTSGSTATYSAKVYDGTYLNRVVPNANAMDSSFKQIDNDLRLHWVLNGNSALDANVTYLNRTHPTYSQRNYSGIAAGANLNWALTGKTTLSAAYARELGAYATSNANYSQTDRFSLGPAWQLSPKALVRLQQVWAQIDYAGTPDASVASSQRRDTTHETTLSLAWQPVQQVTFNTSLKNASRSSTSAGLDYDSTMATFSIQYSY